jgi:CubicO group peptidase (beta-lactamase class C family)
MKSLLTIALVATTLAAGIESTPVTTNDIVNIGSCTKSMTATLAAMFIEEGKLRWDTTIAEVFPELKGKMDKQYEIVTVEQLLTHRGGVPNRPPADAIKRAWEAQGLPVDLRSEFLTHFGTFHFYEKPQGTPVQQRREFIEAVLTQPPQAAPGTQWIYSNQGYAIIGAMLEKIAGKPWKTSSRKNFSSRCTWIPPVSVRREHTAKWISLGDIRSKAEK